MTMENKPGWRKFASIKQNQNFMFGANDEEWREKRRKSRDNAR